MTSKMTIINHYKKLLSRDKSLAKRTKMINHKRFFDKHLSKLIIKSFKVTRAKHSTVLNKDVLVSKLQDQKVLIDRLTSDNANKDNQLKEQDVNLKRLTRILSQEQQLELPKLTKANQKIKALQGQIKRVKPVTTQPKVKIVHVPVTPKPKQRIKHSFWWHLWHKY